MPFDGSETLTRQQHDRCARLLRSGSRSFYVASLLLPRDVREPATALYAFCRLADDLIDLSEADDAVLAELRERLDRAYRGQPGTGTVDEAFSSVVRGFSIPKELPEALIEGFQWDATGRRYPDVSSLHAYAARVAGTVGAMSALLMGVRSPHVLARACDLGIAMQLTNIARDVGEDARAGRLYLPENWMRQAGIDPDAWLSNPEFTPGLGTVVGRLLADAETLYRRSEAGIAALPSSCRLGIGAARFIYAEIGREVERRGYDSVSGRAIVSASCKLLAIFRALTNSRSAGLACPPLPEARFLVDIAAGAGTRLAVHDKLKAASPIGKIAWTIELFEKLEKREYPYAEERGSKPAPLSDPG